MNATERTHLVTDSAVAEPADTDSSTRRSLPRRSLLGTGVVGAGVLGAAVALGLGRPAAATPGTITAADRELATFAISLELTARDLYDAAVEAGASGTAWPILRQQHAAYAERLAGVIGASANARNDDVYDELVDGFAGDTPANAAFGLENTAAATHIELLGRLGAVSVATVVAAVAAMESRHAAFLAERSGRGGDFDALFSNPAAPLLPEGIS